MEAAGLEQRSVVRALDVRRDGVIATWMMLEESTPLVYLERVRLAGQEPLALDRVWLLHVPAGVALLAVERTGCLDGRPVEHRHTVVRGDRFAVTAQYSGRNVVLSAGATRGGAFPIERSLA